MRESTQIRNKIRVIQIPFFRVFIPLVMLFKVARLSICHRNSDNSISAKENYQQNFRVIVERGEEQNREEGEMAQKKLGGGRSRGEK